MDMNKINLGYAEGWGIIYQARTVFAILLLVALVINLAVFFVAKFSGLTQSGDRPIIVQPFLSTLAPCALHEEPAKATSTATAPTTQSAAPAVPDTVRTGEVPADLDRAVKWYSVFSNIMDLTAIIALVSIIFMVFCALSGMMMIIAGHMAGAGFITSAFFWSVGIIALLLPWSNFLPHAACLPIGIPNFVDIQASLLQTCSDTACKTQDLAGVIQLWIRFVVFPIIVILIDLMYIKRFNQAAAQIRSATLPPSEARSGM